MTAQLTDHYGAIDPAAFDADHSTRPLMDREYAATLAGTRLWGNTSYVPGQGNRRMLAIGIVEEGEGGIWTGRTPSGALDGATVTPI